MAGSPHDLNLLAAFAEDRLDETERQQLVAHLAGCAECRATLAAYARASVPAQPRPAGATDTSASWRSWMSVAAMLAILTIGGIVALLNRDAIVPPAAVDPNPGSQAPAVGPPGTTPAPTRPGQGRETAPAPTDPVPPGGTPTLRRGSERIVGGKTFTLVAGEWIDRSYDRFALLPLVDAPTPAERDKLLARVPALRPFAALGPRVLAVHEGTVYRIGPVAHR
jgi:hypothetical protein